MDFRPQTLHTEVTNHFLKRSTRLPKIQADAAIRLAAPRPPGFTSRCPSAALTRLSRSLLTFCDRDRAGRRADNNHQPKRPHRHIKTTLSCRDCAYRRLTSPVGCALKTCPTSLVYRQRGSRRRDLDNEAVFRPAPRKR